MKKLVELERTLIYIFSTFCAIFLIDFNINNSKDKCLSYLYIAIFTEKLISEKCGIETKYL